MEVDSPLHCSENPVTGLCLKLVPSTQPSTTVLFNPLSYYKPMSFKIGLFPYEFPNKILWAVLTSPRVPRVHPDSHHYHNIRNWWRDLPQPPSASNTLMATYYSQQSVLQSPQIWVDETAWRMGNLSTLFCFVLFSAIKHLVMFRSTVKMKSYHKF